MNAHSTRRALAAAAFALLAACQPAPTASPTTPTATGPAATSAATASGPSQAPVATSATGVTLELADGTILGPEDGPPGAQYVMPAAGTRDHDGNLVLVLVWFPEANAPRQIAIAASTDGSSWEVGAGSILASLDIGYHDPGPIPTAILQLDDGSWQLYGWAAADSSGRRFWSWRTSAPDLDGPWTLDATEMLATGPTSSWDSFTATIATVQRGPDGYLAWYEGEQPGSSNRGDIGLATSTDGLAWTKFDDPSTTEARVADSDPVISTGICGAPTGVAVEQPQVERVGERYVALFGGFSQAGQSLDVFAAVSDDGRSWHCASPEPLLGASMLTGSEGIHTMASVPLADGSIGLVIESLGPGRSELWWATVEVSD